MAGRCSLCVDACPQWCGTCGGFVGWHCYVCGEGVLSEPAGPGHCRCVGGAMEWVDGPAPTRERLRLAALRLDGEEPMAEALLAWMTGEEGEVIPRGSA